LKISLAAMPNLLLDKFLTGYQMNFAILIAVFSYSFKFSFLNHLYFWKQSANKIILNEYFIDYQNIGRISRLLLVTLKSASEVLTKSN
jgi:hypothetical protein